METAEFVFTIGPLDPEPLLEQVSRALEKRTELASRAKLPGLWKIADYFSSKPKATEAQRKRHRIFLRICGILDLLLGVILLVPGLMSPREAPVLLLTGAVAIAAGITCIGRGAKKKKDRFLQPAERLLKEAGSREPGCAQLRFQENGIEAQVVGSDSETVPYSDCEYLIEARDVLLLTFRGRAMLLSKQGMAEDQRERFRAFISAKLRFAAV